MRKLTLLLSLLFFITVLSACQETPQSPWVRHTQSLTGYFDTQLSLQIHLEDGVDPEPIFNEVENIYRFIHQIGTRYDGFDGIHNPYFINQNPNIDHRIEEDLMAMLVLAKEYYALTDGLFNIALGPVLDVWGDFMTACNERNVCEIPTQEALNQANQKVNIHGIHLNTEASTVRIDPGVSIDLGAIGKGYAARKVGEYLQAHPDIKAFLLNAGTSNIEVFGTHPIRESGLWVIGLTDPSAPSFLPSSFARISIASGDKVMTSGDYQRYTLVDGVRYHHIIDPRTLQPANTMRAITIVSDDALIGDIYATALFIMTIEEALAVVEALENTHAIIVALDGTIHTSSNFEETFLLELTP